jgi:hypothetical protein
MPRGLGTLQLKLLTALRRHGRATNLESLAALAAGLTPDLDARPPYGRSPSRATYVATARAVAALRRRGLVQTKMVGTRRGRIEWIRMLPDGRPHPRFRFRNPSKYLLVTCSMRSPGPAGEQEMP